MEYKAWKQAFPAAILKRGLKYYLSNAVKEIAWSQERHFFIATVAGTEDYDVCIWLNPHTGDIDHMECSCPASSEYTYCKHMAAVLYQLDAENTMNNITQEESHVQADISAETKGTPLTVQKDWRIFFTDSVLAKAEELVRKKHLHDFSCNDTSASAAILTAYRQYTVQILHAPDCYDAQWNPKSFLCDCGSAQSKTVYLPGKTIRYPSCPHQAALLLYWERQHGPWQFSEPPEVMQKRLQREREAREAKEREKRIEKERVRRRALLTKAKKPLSPRLNSFRTKRRAGFTLTLKKRFPPCRPIPITSTARPHF